MHWNSSSPSWIAGLTGYLCYLSVLHSFEQIQWPQRLGFRYCRTLHILIFHLKSQMFPGGRQPSFELSLWCHLCTAGEQELLIINQSSSKNDLPPPSAQKITQQDLSMPCNEGLDNSSCQSCLEKGYNPLRKWGTCSMNRHIWPSFNPPGWGILRSKDRTATKRELPHKWAGTQVVLYGPNWSPCYYLCAAIA